MSHGLPDFYRGVDIAYQALAELINRPKYGGAVGSQGAVTVTASGITTLLAISGKGMTYGGYVTLDHTSTQAQSLVRLEIDGNLILRNSFLGLVVMEINDPYGYPLAIKKYDNTNFIYGVLIASGITFETSLVLKYEEAHGAAPLINYNQIYALV